MKNRRVPCISFDSNTSSPVATSTSTNGWSVSFNLTSLQFTVGVPNNATVSSGYEVRYRAGRSGIYSATFAVALNGGVLTLSLNVSPAFTSPAPSPRLGAAF